MKIFATFANRRHSPDEIELVDAWDEYSVDANPEGFAQSRDDAVASLGSDLLSSVTVEIVIDEEPIREALNPSVSMPGMVIITLPRDSETEGPPPSTSLCVRGIPLRNHSAPCAYGCEYVSPEGASA